MTGYHTYRLRAENPSGTTVATIREQVAAELDAYEQTLPEQDIDIGRTRLSPVHDWDYLRAVYRFDAAAHARVDITAVAVSLLESLPIAWGTVDYHECPPEQSGAGSDCPDWTREDTIGDPPEGI
jgi:hypothetical protein